MKEGKQCLHIFASCSENENCKAVLKRTSFEVSFGIDARPRRRKGRASAAAAASAASKAVQKPGEDEDDEEAGASSDWQVRARVNCVTNDCPTHQKDVDTAGPSNCVFIAALD